jgi:hypothetical protein
MSEAEEFYDYNILGLYASDQNSVFVDLEITPIKKDDCWEYQLT